MRRRRCIECEGLFEPTYKGQDYCSEECENDDINSSWRSSNYEEKDIGDWDVDDHLAAWYDDMMEK
jgi:hypothetical protein